MVGLGNPILSDSLGEPPPSTFNYFWDIAGKVRLGGISKRGDTYLRTLLIHGARMVLFRAKDKGKWCEGIAQRRPANVVAVALANKMARTAWALLARGGTYQKDYVGAKPA